MPFTDNPSGMPVFEYISGKTNRQRRSLNTHQLSMTIRSQRCETKNGGEFHNGHKNESQALYGIWEGFKTICVLDILGVCVCMYGHLCLVGFSGQSCCYLPTSRSHQTGFLSTTMYTLNTFLGPRKSKFCQGIPPGLKHHRNWIVTPTCKPKPIFGDLDNS